MIALITGDTQIESHPPQDRLDSMGRSIRFQENNQLLREMLDFGYKEGARQLYHLGDLTEEKNPDSASMTAAAEFFGYALKLGYEVFVIAGNHDGALFEVSSSSLAPLAAIAPDTFHAYHKVTRVGNKVFLPFQHGLTPLEIQELIKGTMDDYQSMQIEPLYLFGHYAVAGSKTGPKNLRVPGDTLDSSTLWASSLKRIFMGHIHKQQTIHLGDGLPDVIHPGSAYVVDHGERHDKKGFVLYDFDTDKVRFIEPESPRKWIYADWKTTEVTWTDRDIVKFTGEYAKGEDPRGSIRARIKEGVWPEPFAMTDDLELKFDSRDIRDKAFQGLSGFREAAALYISKKWPNSPMAGKVLDLVLGSLKEANLSSPDKFIVPVSISLRDFMSYESLDYTFIQGEPTLITGGNGRGKTNFFIGVLFALTGEISKKVENKVLVRQTAKSAKVSILLKGNSNYYKIERTVTLTAKGSTQKVKMWCAPTEEGPWDKTTNIADGGVKDTQAILSRTIGATFTGLQATNFMFQRQSSPFIDADSSERKAILGDILGFAPMAAAWKVVNDLRLVSQRLVEDLKTRLGGLQMAWDESKVSSTQTRLDAALVTLPGYEEAYSKAIAIELEAQKIVTTIESHIVEQNKVIKDLPNSSAKLAAEEAWLQGKKAGFVTNKAIKLGQYHKDKAEIDKLKTDLDRADLTSIQVALETSRKNKTEAQTQLFTVDSWMGPLSVESGTLAARLSTVTVDLSNTKNKIKALKEGDISNCPECGAPVDSSHIKVELEKAEKSLADLLTEEAKIKIDADFLRQKLKDGQASKGDLQSIIRVESDNIQSQTAEETRINGLSGEIGKLEKKLLDTVTDGKKANEQHQAEVVVLEAALAKTRATADAEKVALVDAGKILAELEANATTQRKTLTDATRIVSEANLKLSTAKTEINGYKEALAGFEETMAKLADLGEELMFKTEELTLNEMGTLTLKELPIFLLDVRLPEIQDSVNRYMRDFGARKMQIELSSQDAEGKEVLEILVDNGVQPILPVEAYSGGELELIEDCVKKSLSDLAIDMRGVSLGLAAYDEPALNLEKAFKNKFLEDTHSRCSDGRFPVTLVISHDQTLISGFNKRLVIG